MRQRLLVLLLSLLLPVLSQAADASPQKQVVNRIARLNFGFESLAPVVPEPAYLLPPDAKLAGYRLRTEPGAKFQNTLDIDVFFEKIGEYNIGPFVFKDTAGGNISVPPQKILVLDQDSIIAPQSKTAPNDLPPKFYTLRPYQKIYPGTPVYLILEIPLPFKKVTVTWPGWGDVYWERIEETVNRAGSIMEIKYLLLFTRVGDFNLPPVSFRLEKSSREYRFSSSTLTFRVEPLPVKVPAPATLFAGNYTMKVLPHTGTSKDFVPVDITFSGKGYLPGIPAPHVAIHPSAELFLRSHTVTYLSHFPEPQGRADFKFVFIPPADGMYTVSVKPSRSFDPATASFKNISGFSAPVKAMLPSHPRDIHKDDEFQQKMRLKTRPDYDLYALVSIILLFTIFAISMYLKNRGRIAAGSESPAETDHLYIVQRAVLTYLRQFTGQNLATASISDLRQALAKSVIPRELAVDIGDWLEAVSKVRYIERSAGTQTNELHDKGLSLLRRLKAEKTRFSVAE